VVSSTEYRIASDITLTISTRALESKADLAVFMRQIHDMLRQTGCLHVTPDFQSTFGLDQLSY
jgi:hypothetical protein